MPFRYASRFERCRVCDDPALPSSRDQAARLCYRHALPERTRLRVSEAPSGLRFVWRLRRGWQWWAALLGLTAWNLMFAGVSMPRVVLAWLDHGQPVPWIIGPLAAILFGITVAATGAFLQRSVDANGRASLVLRAHAFRYRSTDPTRCRAGVSSIAGRLSTLALSSTRIAVAPSDPSAGALVCVDTDLPREDRRLLALLIADWRARHQRPA
jgi:hypothetical protein